MPITTTVLLFYLLNYNYNFITEISLHSDDEHKGFIIKIKCHYSIGAKVLAVLPITTFASLV